MDQPNALKSKTQSIILSIQIIYEEHFAIREDKFSSSNQDGDQTSEDMLPLDNIHQTLSLELPSSSREHLPVFLQQKEFDGRISLSTCSHSCVTISRQHVLSALGFHKQLLSQSTAHKSSQLQSLIKVATGVTRKPCMTRAKFTRLLLCLCCFRVKSV